MANSVDKSEGSFSADYGEFEKAYQTTKTMMQDIKSCQDEVNKVKTTLSDSEIFMGPIADSCKEEISKIDAFLTTLSENYNTIANYLVDCSNNYKAGDKNASIKVLNIDATSGKISVGGSSGGVVSPSDFAIEPHSELFEGDAERARRLEVVGGECGTREEQDAKMTTIEVPYWDGNSVQQWSLTVNKNLVDNYKNAFQAVADLKFVINPSDGAGAYNYDHAKRPGGEMSDHTLGSAVDINVPNNWGSGDGSSYSVRTREDVIKAFADQGFYWGGDWDSSTDDMHFSFTGF